MIRLAVVVSHPIQHFCSLYASLAADPRIELRVVFGDYGGARTYFDEGFGRTISFGESLGIDRFDHVVVGSQNREVTRSVVWNALGEFNPDVVVVYGVASRLTRFAWLWSLVHRRARLYISDSEDRAGNRSPRRELVSRAMTLPVLRSMTQILCVGDANEEYYRRRGVSSARLTRVPFPVDTAPLEAGMTADRMLQRQRIGASTDEIVVLSVGKMLSHKGHAELVKAASISSKRICLVILGSGELQDAIKNQVIRERVRCVLPGFVQPSELPSWYRAADIYVHPSSIDHHSLSVSEAVYCGLPLIVTDRTGSWGPTDDVRPGENGFVYPSGNPEKLAELLDSFASDESLRRAMGARSREIGLASQLQAYSGFADAVVTAGTAQRA